jgi:uncharacterized membrane protein
MTPYTDLQDNSKDMLFKIASLTLLGHLFFSAFSAFAFATFLLPPYPEWLQTPQNQKVMALGYTYGGATTVTLGAISGLAFLAWAVGTRKALITFAVSFLLALTSEYVGTRWDYPFGAYEYTSQLGYKIGGKVPFNIPTSWFYMLVASLAICGRFLKGTDDNVSKWWWSLVGGVVLTLWDVSMDPAMVKTTHWIWEIGDLSDRSAFEQLIGKPIFFGMPITNWLGWLLTGILVPRDARLRAAERVGGQGGAAPPAHRALRHQRPAAAGDLLPVGHGTGWRARDDRHGHSALGGAAQRSGAPHEPRHGATGAGR